MGLDEPDIDLDELLKDKTGNSSGGGEVDVSNKSKKELFYMVEKQGQVNLGGNKALIKCPENTFGSTGLIRGKRMDLVSMCSLVMRPDPEDGKQKPVCSGPLMTIGSPTNEDKRYWLEPEGPCKGCIYSPKRFKR